MKVWVGKLRKITAVMRGGPPQTKEFDARVVVSGTDAQTIVGEGILVQENTGTNVLQETVWRTVPIQNIQVHSILVALAHARES